MGRLFSLNVRPEQGHQGHKLSDPNLRLEQPHLWNSGIPRHDGKADQAEEDFGEAGEPQRG